MTMLRLDMRQALHFLNLLDKEARHTIASEHPTARNGLPKWEVGATFEYSQQQYLIQDIVERQERGSNIYYSVNRPCKVTERQGVYGKNNIDDIIAIRALAFDIDVLGIRDVILKAITEKLTGEITPSLVIATGGGYHLIYILKELINIRLHRPPKDDYEKEQNEIKIYNRSSITELARDFEHMLRGIFPDWKIDNMSNVDRVMRLPGTINHPKLEKQAKGQRPALAQIVLENQNRVQIHELRALVPRQSEEQPQTPRKPFKPSKQIASWTGYLKAKACCEFVRDHGLADSNEIYTLHVMLPLIGAVHDENEHNNITLPEAEELFMTAISGGARFGVMGRGPGYFMRQWRSHRPELPRNGTKSLGGLIWFCTENGMQLPWKNTVVWEEDYDRMLAELKGEEQAVPDDIIQKFSLPE